MGRSAFNGESENPMVWGQEIRKQLRELLQHRLKAEDDNDPIISFYTTAETLSREVFADPDMQKLKDLHATLKFSLDLIKNPAQPPNNLPAHLVQKTGWLSPLYNSLAALFNTLLLRSNTQTRLNRAFTDLSSRQGKKKENKEESSIAAGPPAPPAPPRIPAAPSAPPAPPFSLSPNKAVSADRKGKKDAQPVRQAKNEPDPAALFAQIRAKGGASGVANKAERMKKQVEEAKQKLEEAKRAMADALKILEEKDRVLSEARIAWIGAETSEVTIPVAIRESYEKIYNEANLAREGFAQSMYVLQEAQEKAQVDFDFISKQNEAALIEVKAKDLTAKAHQARVDKSAAEGAVIAVKKAIERNTFSILTDPAVLREIAKSQSGSQAKSAADSAILALEKMLHIAQSAETELDKAKKSKQEAERQLNKVESKEGAPAKEVAEAREKMKEAEGLVDTAMEGVKRATVDANRAAEKAKQLIAKDLENINELVKFMEKNSKRIGMHVEHAKRIEARHEKHVRELQDSLKEALEKKAELSGTADAERANQSLALLQQALATSQAELQQAIGVVTVLEQERTVAEAAQMKVSDARQKEIHLGHDEQNKTEVRDRATQTAVEAEKAAFSAQVEAANTAITLLELEIEGLKKVSAPDEQQQSVLKAKEAALAKMQAEQALVTAKSTGKNVTQAEDKLTEAAKLAKEVASLAEKIDAVKKTESKLVALQKEEKRVTQALQAAEKQYKVIHLKAEKAKKESAIVNDLEKAVARSLAQAQASPVGQLEKAKNELDQAKEGIENPLKDFDSKAREEARTEIELKQAEEGMRIATLAKLKAATDSNVGVGGEGIAAARYKVAEDLLKSAKEAYLKAVDARSKAADRANKFTAAKRKVEQAQKDVEKLSPEERNKLEKILAHAKKEAPSIAVQKSTTMQQMKSIQGTPEKARLEVEKLQKELAKTTAELTSVEKTLQSHKKTLHDMQQRVDKAKSKGFFVEPGSEMRSGIINFDRSNLKRIR